MARIAFDIKLMRPACVLLQAAFGCDSDLAHRFPTESWLIGITDDMRAYEVTDEQISQLVKKASTK